MTMFYKLIQISLVILAVESQNKKYIQWTQKKLV